RRHLVEEQAVVLELYQPADAADHQRVGGHSQRIARISAVYGAWRMRNRYAIAHRDHPGRWCETLLNEVLRDLVADPGHAHGPRQREPVQRSQPRPGEPATHVVAGVDQRGARTP